MVATVGKSRGISAPPRFEQKIGTMAGDMVKPQMAEIATAAAQEI